MLRLLLEAQTVQNFNLKEGSDEVVDVVAGVGASTWPSRADGVDEGGGAWTGAGPGVGAGGGAVRACNRASRGSVDMELERRSEVWEVRRSRFRL